MFAKSLAVLCWREIGHCVDFLLSLDILKYHKITNGATAETVIIMIIDGETLSLV